jgi:hypothetical protein
LLSDENLLLICPQIGCVLKIVAIRSRGVATQLLEAPQAEGSKNIESDGEGENHRVRTLVLQEQSSDPAKRPPVLQV